MKLGLAVLISAGILTQAAGAQTAQGAQKTITNHDVVVLAKAGFSEEFIIDTILAGRSRFDTSSGGLAELAKEGLNERVMRVMAGVGTVAESAAAPVQPAPAQAAAPAGGEMLVPGTERKFKSQVVKPTRAGLAIATDTPYYESTSLLFGLFKRTVGVGAVRQPDQIVSPQLGPMSNSTRMMANFPTLVAPSGSGTRYVVIP
jgi:hypothetical protein